MIKTLRQNINESFDRAKYESFIQSLQKDCNQSIDFRVAESPVFIPKQLQKKLENACQEIIKTIQLPSFLEASKVAVPENLQVKNLSAHSNFLCIDFAICKDKENELEPQLIELQGFASLFGWINFLGIAYQKEFNIPAQFNYLLGGLNQASYTKLLQKTILGEHDPAAVVLLEIEPHKQKTRVDFYLTQEILGIEIVCLSELVQTEKKLFYNKNGKKIEIKRIYNRIIFDDMQANTNFTYNINLFEDLAVEWVSHPNWFYQISKFSLPFLKHAFVPETQFLSQLKEIPTNLDDYVLKPLFSFAGAGVIFDVKELDIKAIKDPENWVLQKKVTYAAAVSTPEGGVKCEIRMMYLWPDMDEKPTLAISLTRLSRGKMIGVNFNKDLNWVGSSVSFFEQ
jgi:hypothetical protein